MLENTMGSGQGTSLLVVWCEIDSEKQAQMSALSFSVSFIDKLSSLSC